MSKKILTGPEVLKKLKQGVNKLSNAVKITLGPKGRTAILYRGVGSPHVTKDGVTVAKDVKLSDPIEEMGNQIAKQSSLQTNKLAGDGTTTSTILIDSMVNIGYRYLTKKRNLVGKLLGSKVKYSDVNPNKFKEGMEEAKIDVVKTLKLVSNKISNSEELKNIATISCNNDPKMGEFISDIYEELGYNARVTRSGDISQKGEDYVDIKKGYVINRGYASSSFCNSKGNTVSEVEDPIFAIFSKEITDISDLVSYMETAMISKRTLVIIAENFSESVLTVLNGNHLSPTVQLNILALRSPGLGGSKAEELEDLKCALNYKQIEGDKIKSIEDLGSCIKITSTQFDTTFILNSDSDTKKSVIDRVELLKETLKSDDLVDHQRSKVSERISRLEGKIAMIYLHANTEGEFIERVDRLDDALESIKSALEEGYLPGGGLSLLRVSEILDNSENYISLDLDQRKGYKAVLESIKDPFNTLMKSIDKDPKDVMRDLYSNKDIDLEFLNKNRSLLDGYLEIGLDVRDDIYVDLKKEGIIDPTKVVRLAVENSISASSSILTTGCTISLSEQY